MMDVFGTLRARALAATQDWPEDRFRIRGMWKVELAFRPNLDERTFRYTFWLVQTMDQGCCYCIGDDERGHSLVGSDARGIFDLQTCISIAALDSVYASIPKTPAAVHELRGNSVEKTDTRTGIIVEEARRLLAPVTGRRPRVVNVGVVGNVIRELCGQGCEMLATDMEPDTVGKTVHGVTVEDGTRTFERVAESDLAVVTGMTIATDALGPIIEAARAGGAKLLLFCETGANFGEEYCRTLGVDAVVGEPFPFYIFQGVSRIEVFRR
ncbi:MAG: DUF364 domain-containing protein [bacterium]